VRTLKGKPMIFIWLIAIAMLGVLAYVRLAPSDPEVWHVTPKVEADKTFRNGATRRVLTGGGGLKKLETIALTEPRTEIFAGSSESGMITFVSRSRLVGYPDYTTAMQVGEDLLIYARSRFGRRDFGVNAARVDGWIDALVAY